MSFAWLLATEGAAPSDEIAVEASDSRALSVRSRTCCSDFRRDSRSCFCEAEF